MKDTWIVTRQQLQKKLVKYQERQKEKLNFSSYLKKLGTKSPSIFSRKLHQGDDTKRQPPTNKH